MLRELISVPRFRRMLRGAAVLRATLHEVVRPGAIGSVDIGSVGGRGRSCSAMPTRRPRAWAGPAMQAVVNEPPPVTGRFERSSRSADTKMDIRL